MLKDLKNKETRVHVVLSDSEKTYLYVKDTLRDVHNVKGKDIVQIQKRGSLKRNADRVLLRSMDSESWLFEIDYPVVKTQKPLLQKVISEGTETTVFLIRCKYYRDFLECKDMFRRYNCISLNVLNREDISYLLSDLGLKQTVYDFVSRGYTSSPEQVIELREKILNGAQFSSPSSVVAEIGSSPGTFNKFLMDLLKTPPKSFKLTVKNRYDVLNAMVNAYGLSRTQNTLRKRARSILDIKSLWSSGAVYDRLPSNLPGYDVESLKNFQWYLSNIKDIPFQRILRLNTILNEGSRWESEVDVASFLYTYYSEEFV